MQNTPTSRQLFFGTFSVYARCFIGIFIFSLIEAVARAIQLGAFGDIGSAAYIALEIPVWTARVGIVLVILGGGNPFRWRRGTQTINTYLKRPFDLSKKWRPVIFQTILFMLLVFLLNVASSLLAIAITQQHYASFLQNSESLIFFFKNMTVIPFTLVFCYQAFAFIQGSQKKTRKKTRRS